MDLNNNPYEHIEFEKKHIQILNNSNEIIFDEFIEFPVDFDENAATIVASRYLTTNSNKKEHSLKDMINRVSDTITQWCEDQHYFIYQFDEGKDPKQYETLIKFNYKLKLYQIHRLFAFNSPVYFNVGINKPAQTSACFILSIEDNMDSITEFSKTEAKIFKNGSGSGANLSTLRSSKESVSGGGFASGPVSFLKSQDILGGIIKSGGTLRRSAKLACLNIDHPDIEDFINCKTFEEEKLNILRANNIKNRPGYDLSDEVFFQNTNLSVRVTDEFMKAVIEDSTWDTKFVKTGKIYKTYKARDLLKQIARTSWRIAEPGIQFHDTINNWNTLKDSGEIVSSNPCLPAWAPVLTPSGYKYFKDINNKIVINGNEYKCSDLIKTSEKSEVFEVQLSSGISIYVTKNHQITTTRGDIELGNLKIDDKIKMDYTPLKFEYNQEDYEKGFIAGYLFSEGSIICPARGQKFISFSLGIKEFDLETNLLNLLQKYIPNSQNDTFVPHYQKPNTCKVLTFNKTSKSKAIFDLFGTTTKDDFTLFNKSLSYQKGFIEAFITFDGHTVNRQYEKVIKASQSGDRGYKILKEMQLSLASFGIYSSITINNHAKKVERDGKIYNYKTSYNLLINDVWEFSKRFSLFSQEKQKRINDIVILPKKHPSRITNLKEFQAIKCISKFSEEEVFDINVPEIRHFVTSASIVHNCSEFMSLDNTSCNLASINLLNFFNFDNHSFSFHTKLFEDVIKTVITAQDAIIDVSKYPNSIIAENTKKYRNIGLGFTNLGGLLIWLGIPYDSKIGRYIASVLTATMTGIAYTASADLADNIGPFEEFENNKSSFKKVLLQHYDNVVMLTDDLNINDFDFKYNFIKLIANYCLDIWNKLIKRNNFRNAQISLLAPTGTISSIMNAVTTGIEPEYSLVRYKRLSGSDGAILKYTNPIIEKSLENLGYDKQYIPSIINELIDPNKSEKTLIKPEHLDIYLSASELPGTDKYINYMAHLKMCAAVQPFISGAISKTINLPKNCTVDDIYNLYIDAWKMGLKCVIIYRDGSKNFQPLSTQNLEIKKLIRKKLPTERKAFTHKFSVGESEGYITCGLYEDTNELGEIFINVSKEGSTLSGFADALATIISISLQYGVPLEDIVRKLSYLKFEPNGFTAHKDIKIAYSIVDYIARYIGLKFLSSDIQKKLGLIIDDSNHQRISKSTEGAPCPNCGSLMRKLGSCYLCTNCGFNGGSCG